MEYDVISPRKKGFYEKYIKRLLDCACAFAAIVVFGWLYIIIAILVKINLGSPVFFKQPRPGMIDPKTHKERIFLMYKFRSMTNEKDASGDYLPDEQRLTKFGRFLRESSMDELPEAFNILKGDMSVIGPRPQLVRDMIFMTKEQRTRHTVRPGLSGLAQASGRNAISWDVKLSLDLKYIENISFKEDVKLIVKTVRKVFLKEKEAELQNVSEVDLAEDYGEYLLRLQRISIEEYKDGLDYAKKILDGVQK